MVVLFETKIRWDAEFAIVYYSRGIFSHENSKQMSDSELAHKLELLINASEELADAKRRLNESYAKKKNA